MNRRSPIGVWQAGSDDLPVHYAIRHRVFVNEQRVLEFTDIDLHDDDPQTVHALAAYGTEAAGAVRLYRLADGLWQGDRLAVIPPHRSSLVGAELVRFAVATAAAQAGEQMVARIQMANVHFFERLGWTRAGAPAPYFGIRHQPMVFDLTHAPVLDWPGRPDELSLESDGGAQDGRKAS